MSTTIVVPPGAPAWSASVAAAVNLPPGSSNELVPLLPFPLGVLSERDSNNLFVLAFFLRLVGPTPENGEVSPVSLQEQVTEVNANVADLHSGMADFFNAIRGV